MVYAKKTKAHQDEATAALKRDRNDVDELIEVGFVDGLFEMFKLRKDIAKARTELIATPVLSGYRHKSGSFLFDSFISYRFTLIEGLIREKQLDLDMQKKERSVKISLRVFDSSTCIYEMYPRTKIRGAN